MRIKHAASHIDFVTGHPTKYAVSIVGIAPHKTYFIEQLAGFCASPQEAPQVAGEYISNAVEQECMQRYISKYGPQQTQQMLLEGKLKIMVPLIPGVTTDGEWRNPRFKA